MLAAAGSRAQLARFERSFCLCSVKASGPRTPAIMMSAPKKKENEKYDTAGPPPCCAIFTGASSAPSL